MFTVKYYDATGKKVGEEAFDTRHAAQKAARTYVTREGLNEYRRRQYRAYTLYRHYYGDREALVSV